MEHSAKRNRILFALAAIVAAMLACGSSTSVPSVRTAAPAKTQPARPTNTAGPTSTPRSTTAPTQPPELVDRARSVAGKALGESNRDVPRVSAVTLDAEQLMVEFALNRHANDEDIRDLGYIDVITLGGALYAAGFTTQEYYLVATYALVDKYGNTKEEPVLKLWLKPATLAKINWSGIVYDQIPGAADSFWKHPALP